MTPSSARLSSTCWHLLIQSGKALESVKDSKPLKQTAGSDPIRRCQIIQIGKCTLRLVRMKGTGNCLPALFSNSLSRSLQFNATEISRKDMFMFMYLYYTSHKESRPFRLHNHPSLHDPSLFLHGNNKSIH
jgi:hypothetical protein